MPPIVDPYNGRPFEAIAETMPNPAPSWEPVHPLAVRIRTAVHRVPLTRALAEGAEPSASEELGLRAGQLASDRQRRSLARTLRRTINEARKPRLARARMAMVRRSAVLDAEGAISAMIDRVTSPVPVCPQGMAMAEMILNNADRSPLYTPTEPGTLRHAVNRATEAMDRSPAPQSAHEFPLAA
jgi:hypothetical protein